MIYINSKHIIFKTITQSIFIFLREKGYNCCIIDHQDYLNFRNKDDIDNLYIFIGLNKLILDYPKRYIIYQFEQTDSYFYNDKNEKEYNYFFTEEYFNILKNAIQVWDYSLKNINWLKSNLNLNNIIYVPICYCHLLKIPFTNQNKTIDILFYGSLNNKRKFILNKLIENKNYNICIQNNECWDEDLDKIIKNSKIILNLHFYENSTLEMHRISYLLNNSCFVISENTNEKDLMDKYSEGVVFSEYNNIIETCHYWIKQDERKRQEVAIKGNLIFKKEIYDKYLNFDIFKIEDQINKDDNKKKNKKNKKDKKNLIDWYIPVDFKNPETIKDEINNNFILKMPTINDEDLPYISIITPTGNRRKIFSVAINNFYNFIYPREKIEWVIVDDGQQDLSDILSFSKNIKYYKINCSNRLPIGEKRNRCVQNCSNDIIICMDDDDFYTPESLLARVKILLKYPEIECVGCNSIGCYDLFTSKSYLASDGPKNLSEASMAFKKKFWIERNFNNYDTYAENKFFLQYRDKKVMIIPFQFIMVALNHKSNSSCRLKLESNSILSNKNITDLFEIFDLETQNLLIQLKKIL